MHSIKVLPSLDKTENTIKVMLLLLENLNIKVTKTTVRNDLINHPDYPSLLSISDVLNEYGIDNITLKTTINKLSEFPLPCIVPIQDSSNTELTFSIVKSINKDNVTYYNFHKEEYETLSESSFIKKWPSGIALLIDSENGEDEKDYTKKRRREIKNQLIHIIAISIIPILTIILFTYEIMIKGSDAWSKSIYSFLSLTGVFLSSILLLNDLDQSSNILNKFCGNNKSSNCNEILKSKASKIFGISWSQIGFTYFLSSTLLYLLTGSKYNIVFYIMAWVGTSGLLFIPYSIFYQWKIAKQWCRVCLSILVILLLQFIITIMSQWHYKNLITNDLDINFIINVIISILVPIFILVIYLPNLLIIKKNKQEIGQLIKFKRNPKLFEALLLKQKSVSDNSDGLGITLGNPHAMNKIIKVCNPYCKPCADAHKPIEDLINTNSDIQVQIIFSTSNDMENEITTTVKHIMAVTENNNADVNQRILDDWYLSDEKDYQIFARKYPVNNNLDQQNQKIEDMYNWCKKIHIEHTPTFFINGHELPDIYRVQELKYLIQKGV